jgi:hypothetical protein
MRILAKQLTVLGSFGSWQNLADNHQQKLKNIAYFLSEPAERPADRSSSVALQPTFTLLDRLAGPEVQHGRHKQKGQAAENGIHHNGDPGGQR